MASENKHFVLIYLQASGVEENGELGGKRDCGPLVSRGVILLDLYILISGFLMTSKLINKIPK